MTLTKALARQITWCHVFGGRVHAARWDYGGLITLTEDDEGNELCYGDTAIDIASLRVVGAPWRDRKLLGPPVCEDCVRAVDTEQMWTEL